MAKLVMTTTTEVSVKSHTVIRSMSAIRAGELREMLLLLNVPDNQMVYVGNQSYSVVIGYVDTREQEYNAPSAEAVADEKKEMDS